MSEHKFGLDTKNEESYIQKMPLEIIAKIVRQLSLSDIKSLLSVSKIWRSTFLNQNIIWMEICKKLNVQDKDYAQCLKYESSQYFRDKEYFEITSVEYFGPICYWRKIFNQYNTVLKNIKDNNLSIVHIPRKYVSYSYCTDNYIINIYAFRTEPCSIEAIILGGKRKPVGKQILEPIGNFYKLLTTKEYDLKIIGNHEFLVLEIHSVIFVYKIINYKFILGYSKVIQESGNLEFDMKNINSFLDNHCDTIIDLSVDKFALIHPKNNVIFLIDLMTGDIRKELVYSTDNCTVDTMKCADQRLMIGISIKNKENDTIKSFHAVVYHFEENEDDEKFKVSLFGAVTQFKVTENYIGIENTASATPILIKTAKLIRIFWIECDTFSFDCTRKVLYFNVNKSIFLYDLNKSCSERYEVTQKIAIDTISNNFSLTPINDRFLLVKSTMPNMFDIFDVKERALAKCIPVASGFQLIHVGKLSIVFASSNEYRIFAFS